MINWHIFKEIECTNSIVSQSNQFSWILQNLEATTLFGQALSKELNHFKILLLEGPIGAGKTSLVKGIALGLGIIEPITSPTFALAQHYLSGSRPLIHIDLYRLENPLSAYELFLQEEESANEIGALMIIEWGSRLQTDIDNALKVKLEYHQHVERKIYLEPPSSQ